jgi:Txe/YoeB family toxin of Txe-Axe toxin-antitoxin module
MSEFVDSCKIEISDLEETGELGYVEGISRILIKNLEELGLDLRPMHCSDMKREVVYIKDNNVWVKEAENQEKIKNVIREISNKNFKQIYEWQKINPDFSNPQSRVSDRYQKLLFNILPGITQEEQSENINKIFKNIIKQITIDK